MVVSQVPYVIPSLGGLLAFCVPSRLGDSMGSEADQLFSSAREAKKTPPEADGNSPQNFALFFAAFQSLETLSENVTANLGKQLPQGADHGLQPKTNATAEATGQVRAASLVHSLLSNVRLLQYSPSYAVP